MSGGERGTVGIAGPLLGGNTGWVTSPGEMLAARLRADGWGVTTTSAVPGRVGRAIDTVRTMRRWRGRVDVVVVLVFSGPGFAMADLGSRMARRLDVPLVLWLHGGGLPRFADRHPRWVHRVFSRAERLVAPSAYLTRVGRFAAEVIPNLIPDVPEAPSAGGEDRPPRLLWMRTFHPLYRPEWAIDVLADVRADLPGATLTMAGQDRGGLEPTRAAAAARGVAAAVRFAGFLDPAAKAVAFGEHDVFLNTSRTDNAPVSLIEASVHGLPVVTTPVGGIPDLFPAGTGALLGDDPATLATHVVRIATQPALADRLAAEGRRRGRAFTWAEVGPLWKTLLAEVARG